MITGKWEEVLKPEFSKPYYRTLYQKVQDAYRTKKVFPPAADVFNAFTLTPFEKVRVVILGQDPYHEEGQAEGLAFSVKDGVPLPPSLVNIFKELKDDLNIDPPSSGSLRAWAGQGVLLLNAVLTVEAHRAFSHSGFGWEEFTDACLKALDKEDRPMVFILWGNSAIRKKEWITNPHRLIITSPHPSPLSAYRGFFGSRPFSRTNNYLVEQGEEPIQW